ncbi:MAG: S1C family serine protease [Nitrososphaerales archaeon]
MSEKITPLSQFSDAMVELVESLATSVVSVNNRGRGAGTGTAWSEDGYIVTNSHVVHRSESAQVELNSGEIFDAKIVGRDHDTDLALLKLDGVKLKPAKLGDSDDLKVGQLVLAVANAFGGQPAVTSGIITSSRRSVRGWGPQFFENVVVSDAQVNPGYSGGPLVDALGRVVALNTAFAFSRSLSIPINKVKEVAEKLKKYGRVKRGYLGVVLDPIALPEIENHESGLMILSVSKESPASQTGLAIGDILVGFDGKTVSSYGELRKLLGEDAIGVRSKISVLRGGKMSEFEITPADDESRA